MKPEKFNDISLSREVLENTPLHVLVSMVLFLAEQNRLLKELVDKQQARIEQLEARLNQDSTNSNKPPSSGNPLTKTSKPAKKMRGKRKKRNGARQQSLRLTEVVELLPGACKCGTHEIVDHEPYYIHQVIELPEIELDVRHVSLYKGHCAHCDKMSKAHIPYELRSGYGPLFSAMVAEMAGTQADSRRTIKNFCASVLDLPISLGGIQKIIDRVSSAIKTHYEVIADVTHNAPVNHVDETSWRRSGALMWLCVMGNAFAAYFKVHYERLNKAFEELKGDWSGILVSDDYVLYRKWTGQRQSCLAHLIRRAKALSESKHARVASCGAWAHKELRRLCRMAAKAPPTVGEWNMFYARFIRLTTTYGEDKSEAGAFARRLRQEMVNLWLFLEEEDVSSTNNHAERLLRFAVTWRKSRFGVISKKAKAGSNASCPCARGAGFKASAPTRCWLMPCAHSFVDNSQTSFGFGWGRDPLNGYFLYPPHSGLETRPCGWVLSMSVSITKYAPNASCSFSIDPACHSGISVHHVF